jgi:hypothetical protein
MADLVQSNVTYSGAGQVTSPAGSGALDPSVMALGMGGTRLFAIYAAYQQLQALKSNLTIAQNYYNENHKDFAFWLSVYQGTMQSALTEAMQRQFYNANTFTPQYGALDYLASTGRGQSRAALRIDREWQGARRRISKYNVGLGKRIDYKYAIAKMNSELEGWNLGYRYEDHRKMVYDDQRHAHQAEILNLGIGATNAARAGLATSVAALSEAKAQKAGQFGALSNGLSTFAGFQQQTQGLGRTAPRQYSASVTVGAPIDLRNPQSLPTAPQRTSGTDMMSP